MKAERRHELQHNELSDWVGDTLAGVQPYWRLLVGGLVLMVGVLIAVGVLSNRRVATESDAWSKYLSALSTNNLEAIAEVGRAYPGTTAALWAYQRIGDAALADGTRLMFENREEAAEKLAEAIESYEFVASHAEDPLLKQQSTFGMAQALEASNKLDEAATKYEWITQHAAGSTVAALAQKRLDVLRQKGTAEFYAWFYAQKPAPAPTPPPPASGTPGLNDLPSDPDISVPGRGNASTTPPAESVPPPASLDEIDFGTDGPGAGSAVGPELTPPQTIPPDEHLPADIPATEPQGGAADKGTPAAQPTTPPPSAEKDAGNSGPTSGEPGAP